MKRYLSMVRIVAAALFILDSATLLGCGYNINLGVALPGIVGIGLLAAPLIQTIIRDKLGFRFASWEVKAIKIAFAAWLVSVIIVEGLICHSSFKRDDAPCSWVIVLGAGLRGDAPSPALVNRMTAAIDYLQRNPGARAILSGGKGFEESITEAEAMWRFMVDHGITPNRIFKEERSTSTLENLQQSKLIASDNGMKPTDKIVLVTNGFHMFRAQRIADHVGLRVQPLPAPTSWLLLPNVCAREYFAIIYNLIAIPPWSA